MVPTQAPVPEREQDRVPERKLETALLAPRLEQKG
jgi:hypothetical protein